MLVSLHLCLFLHFLAFSTVITAVCYLPLNLLKWWHWMVGKCLLIYHFFNKIRKHKFRSCWDCRSCGERFTRTWNIARFCYNWNGWGFTYSVTSRLMWLKWSSWSTGRWWKSSPRNILVLGKWSSMRCQP